MSKVTVVDTDRGYAAIVGDLLNMHMVEFTVGVREGDKVKSVRRKSLKTGDITLAQIAALHEYGCPKARIPQRSFLRATFDEQHEKQMRRVHDALLRAIQRHTFKQRNTPAVPRSKRLAQDSRWNGVAFSLDPRVDVPVQKAIAKARSNMLQAALDDAMETEAVVTVGEVKKRIITGPFVPNAPTTIAKKGSDKPLIDTGQLLDAIDYKMHKPGQKE